MTSPKTVLIIDDEENMRHMLSAMIERMGIIADTASNGYTGLKKIEKKMAADSPYSLIICDIKMPRMDGIAFLKSITKKFSTLKIIMMSAYGTIDIAVDAMKLGAFDYISKPFRADEISLVIEKAWGTSKNSSSNTKNTDEASNFSHMDGESPAIKQVFALAQKAAKYPTTILITGGSGTGKELIAKGIHQLSDRADKPMICVNCGGIPETLMESEFFGYKKGAFTDAKADRKGLFEEADTGTLFLDEIGELPVSMQVKLLRVLQEDEIRAVGDVTTRKVDVRIIAATARNLEEEIRKGRFRKDLFYRLNVISLELPPLRKRPDDIPLLCQRFINRFNKRLKKNVHSLSPEALEIFYQYPWPGNIRELENIIERAMVLAEGTSITEEDLPPTLNNPQPPLFDEPTPTGGFSLKAAKKHMETQMIKRALKETGGNKTRAAKLLEISHPSLLNKIKSYQINT